MDDTAANGLKQLKDMVGKWEVLSCRGCVPNSAGRSHVHGRRKLLLPVELANSSACAAQLMVLRPDPREPGQEMT